VSLAETDTRAIELPFTDDPAGLAVGFSAAGNVALPLVVLLLMVATRRQRLSRSGGGAMIFGALV